MNIHAPKASRTTFYLIGVLSLAACALVTVFLVPNWFEERSEGPQEWGGQLYRQWQKTWWDYIAKGHARWGEYKLVLPVRQYGWINHKDGDIEIFSRTPSTVSTMTLKKAERADWPFQSYVETICGKPKACANRTSSNAKIGDKEVRVLTYEEPNPERRIRLSGFLFLAEPRILIHIGCESPQDGERLMQLGLSLLEQISNQARAAKTTSN